ncbi:MAG: M3 family peptidase [Saprospirales bacterium]|nr:MAG: M3 family peptidase [Saprospirales bacterium]
MKNLLMLMIFSAFSYATLLAETKTLEGNPLLEEFDTPYGVPPFDKIEEEHFLPAILEGIKIQQGIIQAIIDNPEPPDFYNTIVMLDNSSAALSRVLLVFYNLASANTNAKIQEIAQEAAPKLSANSDDIILNMQLFERINEVYRQKDELNLDPDQKKLLEDTHRNFVRGGAELEGASRERLREINSKLSVLTLQFGDNVLADVNDWKMVIDNEEDLAGLPQSVRDGAASAAEQAGMEGKWVFTLHPPSALPFLSYADNRDLRKRMIHGYTHRGNNDNEYDNKEILTEITNLRLERANLLGYETFSHFALEVGMANDPETVNDLLQQLWEPALRVAEQERDMLQQMVYEDGHDFEITAADWRYYSEKVRLAEFDVDDEALRPYFEKSRVVDGMFEMINRLWGLTFEKLDDIPVHHEDVEVYKVLEKDGSLLGIFYMDLFPRASKRSGAWMSSFRTQSVDVEGNRVHPIVTIVCNFSAPSGDRPALFSLDEVTTLYHEMGHALHGLMSDVRYRGQAGTSVSRDFVELPSQLLENWVTEREMLELFAFHYETGELIPEDLVDRMEASALFGTGFRTVEYLASSWLDMAYYHREEPLTTPINEFEAMVAEKINKPSAIPYRHASTHFQHIFSGGYASNYYSYIWSEVLDADAFTVFKEGGLFNRELGESLREHILSTGGTAEPMDLYKRFRGSEPDIQPLLERRGLVEN